MNTNRLALEPTSVLFVCPYGRFQPGYWWLFGFVALVGVAGVPIGIFFNEGWEMGGHPLQPWSATLIIEIFAVGALLIVGGIGLATWQRRTSPHRVAVTETHLIVPKGHFSNAELALPLNEIKTALFNLGFVKQLQIKHGRRRVLLTSALFPSNAAFDRLVSQLGML